MQTEEQREKWLADRKKIVGASEMATVIKASNFGKEELEKAMGGSAEFFMQDDLFKTPYSLYCEKKGLPSAKFPRILSEYGHEMEKYLVKNTNIEFKGKLITENQPQEVIYGKSLHKLAGYTPDAFIEFTEDFEFLGQHVKKGDKAVFEIKTSSKFQFDKENWGCYAGQEELKMQHIIQGQTELWVENSNNKNFKWLVMACVIAKEKFLDSDGDRGKAITFCHYLDDYAMNYFKENYKIEYWIYPVFKTMHPIFLGSLNDWEERLQNCSKKPKAEFKELLKKMPDLDFSKKKDTDHLTNFIKKHYEDIRLNAIEEFGADENGIIQTDKQLLDKYPNIFDKFLQDKLHREENSQLTKDSKKSKSELKNILLNLGILGVNLNTSTIHLSLSVKGSLTLNNNFKKTDEILQGITKIKREFGVKTTDKTIKGKVKVKNDMTGEDLMRT